MSSFPDFSDPNLLVSGSTMDDAGIYRLNDNQALVQTVDFFTPIVDDPYTFGLIAAANALSDIYAMGGSPVTALNIAAFPTCSLPLEALKEILLGGADKIRQAEAVVVGGHTIEDKEPKYGLAVTGLINPQYILKKTEAAPGDAVVLTKPLGTGIITTGVKGELASEKTLSETVKCMVELNNSASEAALQVGAKCCTDVTGFGLLGHTWEICAASSVTIEFDLQSIPLLPDVYSLAGMGVVPAGAKTNLKYMEDKTEFINTNEIYKDILADPQTSGGLLIILPMEKTRELIEKINSRNDLEAAVVGRVFKKDEPGIIVKG